MNPPSFLSWIVCSSLLLAAGSASAGEVAGAASPAPPADATASDDSLPPAWVQRTGEALEVLDAGRYTYVRLGDGSDTWIAGPIAHVAVGDEVWSSQGNEMRDFSSPRLKRTFPVVWFVGRLQVAGDPGQPGTAGAALSPEPLAALEGGTTVAMLHAGRAELAGKSVALRARVVKVSLGILQSNWLHVRDGTGSAEAGDNDLLVTTQNMDISAAIGDVVVVRGILALDKDLGSGYRFDLLVEGATLQAD